ncbi:MAG: valine--tRNA ligase [Euryarchaeota archaeon]|nr:valine--tRNA ligase [Euryarchaeota archaeon]
MGNPKISEKRWSIDLEKEIQQNHYQSVVNSYKFNPQSSKEIFVIDTPPPYPSGIWHIGAVAQYSMIDVIARSQRLLGKEVFFPWGVDRNGINIEFTVEKKMGRKMRTFDREDFLNLCRETIEEYTQEMKKTAKRVGLSCDFDKEYYTDSSEYRTITQSIFVDLFKKGEIIEDLRPNIYDPIEETTIADAEVQRISRKTKICDVKWMTEDNEEIIITTTRPEMICACGVVVVHPDDTRYTNLIGKNIFLPIDVNDRSKSVKILSHPSVKMNFGSGVLMVCSFGDQNDVSIFRELDLKPFQAINLEGKMTSIGGPLAGLTVLEARSKAIEILSDNNSISEIHDHIQDIPVSERGNNPVEIILLKEWYVKQTHVQDRLRVLSGQSRIIPERNRQLLHDWMDGISIDWPISRRRWYHTEIPIWYSEDETKIIVPPSGIYVQPWKDNPPKGSEVLDRETREFISLYDPKSSNLGKIKGEDKVFDTWMDSSNSNLFVSGYLNDDELFQKSFPTALRPQGKEIVRTWLYYTMLKSALLLDMPAFNNIWIDGLGMDPWGRKMSKSIGNGIDANSVLECGFGGRTGSWKIRGPSGKQVHLQAKKIGSECFRLWKACDAQVGDDFHINPEEIESKYFGVLTKIFNVARFTSQFEIPQDLDTQPGNLSAEDIWILSEYEKNMKNINNYWINIDIYNAAQSIKNFTTGIFASHWLEMAKTRLYSGDKSASWTLHRIVRDIITVFTPICPFFCHHISTTIYGTSSITIDKYPDSKILIPKELANIVSISSKLIDFNSHIWKLKKEKGISLKSPISGVIIPKDIEILSGALINMHNLE